MRTGPARHLTGSVTRRHPAMLGYYPADSLLLIVLTPIAEADAVQVRLVARTDFHVPDDQRSHTLRAAAQVCTRENATAALAVIIDSALIPDPTDLLRAHRRLATDLHRELTAVDVQLASAWATPAIERDAPWWDLLDPGIRGVIADPDASVIAAAQVLEGNPIYRSRAEIAGLVEPDPALLRTVSLLLPSADTLPRCVVDDSVDVVCAMIERLLVHIDAVAAGIPLTAADVAELGMALRDKRVRD
ncbi:DUF4192 domain-containing protein [Nocardia terpenica]|nr:DUF4192 domain-containing protein [Nocardia terpenica]